jgi:hypothetical protein
MQRSSIGQRKNSMMLFIPGLGAIIVAVLFGKKSQAQPGTGKTIAPLELRDPMKLTLKNYENWLAVSKMETAGWTSGPFRNANNPWGMQMAYIRPHSYQNGGYRASQGGKLANYDSLVNAVMDLQDWIDYNNFPEYEMSLPQHIQAMHDAKSGSYFGESVADYLALVMAWQSR